MAEHPQGMKSETGTVELHHEPSAFGITAPGFVAIAMLVVIGIVLWKRVPAMIGKMLDAKIDSIRQQLDQASALRAEAEAELAAARARNAASEADAAAIVAHAEAEAKALLKKAEADARELTKRRQKMAEDKIAAAERAAVQSIRAKAADAAAHAAAALIAEKHGAEADKALVDKTIARLGRLN